MVPSGWWASAKRVVVNRGKGDEGTDEAHRAIELTSPSSQGAVDGLAWRASSTQGARDAHRVISHGGFLASVRCGRGDAEASFRARSRALRRATAGALRAG